MRARMSRARPSMVIGQTETPAPESKANDYGGSAGSEDKHEEAHYAAATSESSPQNETHPEGASHAGKSPVPMLGGGGGSSTLSVREAKALLSSIVDISVSAVPPDRGSEATPMSLPARTPHQSPLKDRRGNGNRGKWRTNGAVPPRDASPEASQAWLDALRLQLEAQIPDKESAAASQRKATPQRAKASQSPMEGKRHHIAASPQRAVASPQRSAASPQRATASPQRTAHSPNHAAASAQRGVTSPSHTTPSRNATVHAAHGGDTTPTSPASTKGGKGRSKALALPASLHSMPPSPSTGDFLGGSSTSASKPARSPRPLAPPKVLPVDNPAVVAPRPVGVPWGSDKSQRSSPVQWCGSRMGNEEVVGRVQGQGGSTERLRRSRSVERSHSLSRSGSRTPLSARSTQSTGTPSALMASGDSRKFNYYTPVLTSPGRAPRPIPLISNAESVLDKWGEQKSDKSAGTWGFHHQLKDWTLKPSHHGAGFGFGDRDMRGWLRTASNHKIGGQPSSPRRGASQTNLGPVRSRESSPIRCKSNRSPLPARSPAVRARTPTRSASENRVAPVSHKSGAPTVAAMTKRPPASLSKDGSLQAPGETSTPTLSAPSTASEGSTAKIKHVSEHVVAARTGG